MSVRPYRVAPELKDEIERQIKELLEQGVITHSNSAFGYCDSGAEGRKDMASGLRLPTAQRFDY